MAWLINLVAQLSDPVILAFGAISTAALAYLIAVVARRFWFEPRGAELEAHAKLADLVHGSLLAFAVFILALVLADVRSNLARADDAALREGSTLARFDRDLAALGPGAAAARAHLKSYVGVVVGEEWKTLGQREPALSRAAENALALIAADVRALGAANPDVAGSLRGYLDKLEDFRQGRLEAATKSLPSIFWWMVSAFLLGAMALNGRHKMDAHGAALIVLHMAAIGLVVALIIIMDEPFRGDSSISSAPLAKAVGI